MAWSCALALALRDRLHVVEFLAPLGDLLGRELREVVVVALPGCIVRPPERGLHGGTRPGRALEHPERQLERLPLRFHVEWPSRLVAEREIAEEEARHAAVLDDVLRAAHDHGR